MIVLQEMRKIRKSLVLQQADVRKTLSNTQSYADRLKSRLKDIDESLSKMDKEMIDIQTGKGVSS